MIKKSEFYSLDLIHTGQPLPFYEYIHAGFPSPAQDYAANPIDLNIALMLDAESTKIFEIRDRDLEGANIFENDWAVIHTNMYADNGYKLSCCIEGEDINRIVKIKAGNIYLTATNPKIKDITITDSSGLIVNGIITYTITPHIASKLHSNSDNCKVDLNKLLIRNKTSTFLGLIKGSSMKGANILDGDLAVIDKSLPYLNTYKALCQIEDKFTLKYLQWDKKDKNTLWLMPSNEEFQPIRVNESEGVKVWGIVTHTITPHIRRFLL